MEDVEVCKRIFTYKGGKLYYNNIETGHKLKSGYTRIRVGGQTSYAHRIIFAIHYGYFPVQVDHIDRVKTNNLISNLREANNQINSFNKGVMSTNTSGVTGVSQIKDGRWRVQMMIRGRVRGLGTFNTKEEAIAIRKAAEIKHQSIKEASPITEA